MKRILLPLFALAVVSGLVIPTSANAFFIRVNVRIYESFAGQTTQAAGGGFIFDSDYFVLQSGPESSHYIYSGLVPAHKLRDSGIDWFAGQLAGEHWDFSDISLAGDFAFSPIQPWEGDAIFGWSWWWFGSAAGPSDSWGFGGDGAGYKNIGEYGYPIHWTAETVPEPGTLALLGPGLLALGLIRRRNSSTITPA